MMGASYYSSVWSGYGIDVKHSDLNTAPTAEGLRAAAKVLEEKAKELDKPRYTERQQAFIDGGLKGKLGISLIGADLHTSRGWYIDNAKNVEQWDNPTNEGWCGSFKKGTIRIHGTTYPTVMDGNNVYIHWDRL